MEYVTDWSENATIKAETLYPHICDVYTILFTKASAILKMHTVISKENKVNITYEIYNRAKESRKIITHFGDAKEYFDNL